MLYWHLLPVSQPFIIALGSQEASVDRETLPPLGNTWQSGEASKGNCGGLKLWGKVPAGRKQKQKGGGDFIWGL